MRDKIIEYYKNKESVPEVADIVGSLCWVLPTIKQKSPERKMLDKVDKLYREKYVRKYLEESFGDIVSAEETLNNEGIDIQGGFCLDGETWLDIQPVSAEEWKAMWNEPKRGQQRVGPLMQDIPANLLRVATAVFRSWVRGYSSSKVSIMFLNRNNQYFKVVDFFDVSEKFLKEAQMRLYGASSKEYGADMCAWCPVRADCKSNLMNLINPKTDFLMQTSMEEITYQENGHYKDKIYQYLEGLNAVPSPSHNDGWLHPSEMAITTCDRRLAYALQLADKKEKIVPYLRTIFNVGHCVHDVLQEAMTSNGIPIEILAEDKEAKIHGRTDGSGDTYIVEIKSAADSSYKKFEAKGPSEAHLQQTSVYSSVLKKDEVRFQYFNKNNGNIMEIVTPHNQTVYDLLKGRALSVVNHVQQGTLPSKINKRTECKQCPYLEICKGDI